MNHILSLEVLDTLNQKVFRVTDLSVYNEMVATECPLLEITAPGFVVPTQFDETVITPGFALNLTACDLGLQSEDCDSKPLTLPDGVYIVKYSLSPKDIVYAEYNYLRITNIMNTLLKYLCDIPLADIEPNIEVSRRLQQLRQIEMYIKAAKAQVEIAHNPKKGMQLYTYAMKLLTKFDCKTC